MKTNYKWILALFTAFSVSLAACNEAKKEDNATTENAGQTEEKATAQIKPAVETSEGFKSQIDGIATDYLATKDALVASDSAQANSKVSTLLENISKVEAASLSPDAQQKWQTHQQSLQKAAQQVQSAQGLEAKRTAFEDLSTNMYQLVTDFGTTSTLYKQYCPMALNDKGAYWLSAQSDIKNPYFGDAMLTCGEVQETLTFAK
jgi:Cu(I)/Ag(I) efflux system membrane fusion protein